MGSASGLAMRLKTALLAVAAAVSFAGGLAQAQIIGEPVRFKSEFRVNTTTEGDQQRWGVFALATGDYVVAWRSVESAGRAYYIQRYRGDATRIGSEVRIAADGWLVVTPFDDGGYVLAWGAIGSSGDMDIFTRRYTATHIPMGPDRQVNTVTTGKQYLSNVTALKGGGYVVVWNSDTGFGAFARQFSPANLPMASEKQINTYNGAQGSYDIAALEDGGFIAVWTSYGQDGSDSGVYAQRFRADGTRFGGERRVSSFTDAAQRYPGVFALKDGGHVVFWNLAGPDRVGKGISGQRYRADNTRLGGEFRVTSYSQNYNDSRGADLIALDDGSFVVAWASMGPDGSARNVYAQRYNAVNARIGVEQRLNTSTVGDKSKPRVLAAPDGGYWIIWSSGVLPVGSGHGVYAQRFAADHTRVGDAVHISRSFGYDDAVVLADGGLFVAWTSSGQDWLDSSFDSAGVYGRRITADGRAVGREFPINTFVVGDQAGAMLARLADGKVVAVWSSSPGGTYFAQDGSRSGVYSQVFRVTGAPVAKPDKANTTSGVPAKIPVLSNDMDPDIGDSLTIVSATATSGGAIINADNTITYRPSGSCVETDTVTYTIRDLAGLTSTSTVGVRIAKGPGMRIGNTGGFLFSGPAGGPFLEREWGRLFMTNYGCTDLEWEVLSSVPWLSVQGSPTGTLVPGDQTFAVIEPNATGLALPRGTYKGWVIVRNRTNGVGNTRLPVYLSAQ